MPITSKQRAQLRGLAMEEDTIIQVGKGGITENLVASVNAALKARELVKGKVLENSMLTARQRRVLPGQRHQVCPVQTQRERAENPADQG